MTTSDHPAIGRLGEPATAVEVALLATPTPDAVFSPSDQLRAVAQRIAVTLIEAGQEPRDAYHAAAVAVVTLLDEMGTERIRMPSRRGFFLRLLRPQLGPMCRSLAGTLRAAQIAAVLGVSRRTVERAMAGCDKPAASLSRHLRGDSRG